MTRTGSFAMRRGGRAAPTLDLLVGRQVAGAPGRVAIRHRGAVVSYGELWARAGRWLAALHTRNIGRGDLVGV